ncbi:MAG: catalase [Herpetosiphonaceae bacterium]|nr:catalase [Herpetosiphonaceae bacterium]
MDGHNATNGHQEDGHVSINEQSKDQQLDAARVEPGEHLTTNHGTRISDNQNSLRAGARGPTLLEDFVFREKITHFDHERIPERVVHARGSGAHGFFQVYESMAPYTKAAFLQDPAVKTPVFVRFSTVAGFRGSADTARDVRGWATRFYTADGNFDLVGNNIPVFFIQDAIKFPDLIHAVKPEPHNEIPQASSAHDTFYDFISLVPESMHMMMWVMSDRAIPRSLRMMEGFGIHTFRFVNDQGKSTFVKFHWKPLLGVHGLAWDEAQKIAGKDPDFHRRDLWEAIENGDYPEYEFGVQLLAEEDEFKFDFDILDATKIWPEDLVPAQRIGKLTLNRNPDNFFAETEQVAFHPGHVVPGIDFSNDPLLQGRLFSYIDTQITRIGQNFAELPINKPVAPVHNNQRDGKMRYEINKGRVAYEPNSLGGGCPMQSPENLRGYVSYPAQVEGPKVRVRSETFGDHFSQATLFWNSMSTVEQEHIAEALQFELGKVQVIAIRERMIALLARINRDLAVQVAYGIGVAATFDSPPPTDPSNIRKAPGLSMLDTVKDTIKTRRIAILAMDGVDLAELTEIQAALKAAGARSQIVSKFLSPIKSSDGKDIVPDATFITSGGSIMYDAVIVPGGAENADALKRQGDAVHFLNEAYKHGKAIGATGAGANLLAATQIPTPAAEASLQATAAHTPEPSAADVQAVIKQFIAAVAQHRDWNRLKELIPA